MKRITRNALGWSLNYRTADGLAIVRADAINPKLTDRPYRGIDCYTSIPIDRVRSYVSAYPDTKKSALRAAILTGVKHHGPSFFDATDHIAPSPDSRSIVDSLSVYGSAHSGCISAVCIPLSVDQLAAGYELSDNPPASFTGLLASIKTRIEQSGTDPFFDRKPSDASLAAVRRLAPAIDPTNVPDATDATDVTAAIVTSAIDSRTVTQLKKSLKNAKISVPKKSATQTDVQYRVQLAALLGA